MSAPPLSAPRRPARPALRTALIVVGLLVSAAFTWIAVRDAHLADVWAALVDARWAWLVPALAALGAWFFLRVIRWRVLFAAGRRPPFGATTSALYVGYFLNAVLPARAGEAGRIVALNRSAGTPAAEVTATVVLERVFDLLSLLLLLFVTLPWLPDLTWVRAAAVLAAALAAVLVAAITTLAIYGERPVRFAFRQLGRLPFVPEHRLRHSPANFVHGLRGLRHPGTAAVAFGWTTLSWIVMGLSAWCVLQAFSLGLSPLAGELVVVAVGLSLVLPSTPGGVGVVEGATVIVLTAYGVDDSDALSCALVLHALNLVPFLVFAPLVLRSYRGGRAAVARA